MQTLTIKDKTYNLKFTTLSMVNLEAKLNKNPINIFSDVSGAKIPKFTDIMLLLHEALQPLNHGISLEDTYNLFDEYCQEGGDFLSMTEIIVNTLQDSGFIPKDEDSKN